MNRTIPFLLLAGASGLAFAVPAAAQSTAETEARTSAEQDTLQDQPPADGAIVVTGSRIQRDSFSAPVPINLVDTLDLQSSGYTNLAEALADLPQASLDDSPLGPTSGENQNSGLSSVSLRNIGGNRTLTLIDGRRTVSNAANRSIVSTNTIPIDFVDRVEIITGAASAIYGSDGIAGVVNIITPKPFNGLKISTRFGTSLNGRGGATEKQFSALAGRRFADGRGSIMVGASWEDDGGLKARDRDRALRSRSFNYRTNEVTDPSLTTFLPGGWFNTTAAATSYFYNENGLNRGFVTARDGFDIAPYANLRVPRTSLSFAGKFEYEFSEAATLFASAMYNKLETTFERAPVGISSATQVFPRDPATGVIEPGTPAYTTGRIPRANPFAPAAIRAGATATGIAWFRRFMELGNTRFNEDRRTLRSWVGLRGKLGGDWNYEASYGYGDFKQNQLRENGLNLQNVRYALDAVSNGAAGFQCRDADARANGCVPLNVFGLDTVTPEMADYIRANTELNARLKQHVAQAYVTGSLFDLPAGPVKMATGIEWRRDSTWLESDPITRSGYTTNAVVPSFAGSINVKEAFAELSVPLVRDKPGFYDLSLDLAGRVGDYSIKNVGTVASYRIGAGYAPFRDLRFRAQYGTAQRAPDLAELTSPPRDDINTIYDPCSGITATTAGDFAINCRRDAGIASVIAENGVFMQSTTSISSPNAGNLDLSEETAKTLTAGFVLQPRWLRNLSLAADYYHIRVTNAIDSFSNEFILDQCYGSGAQPNEDFCQYVTRSAENGQIQQIIQAQQNLNRISTSGIDVRARYRTRLDGIGVPGNLRFGLDWNHLLKYETEYTGINGPEIEDARGTAANPADRIRGFVGYARGPLYLQWRTTYISPFVSSKYRQAEIEKLGITDPKYLYYDPYFRHDLYMSLSNKNVMFYAGITNLFNNSGPELPTGATPGAFNSYTSTYGVIGRTGYVGFEFKM